MNKFCKYFAFASLVALASCSNDEPAEIGGNEYNGEPMYMNISLRDANDLGRSRAGEEGEGVSTSPVNPFEYVYGTENEGKVSNARFFFFDADGNYWGQTNGWAGGTANSKPNETIEFNANSLVVIYNEKTNQTPTYMVTLLNVPTTVYTDADMATVSLSDFGKKITSWGENKDGGFVMATSSYFADATDTHRDNKYYFANKLNPTDFARTPELAKQNPTIDVYVERLASRVQLASPATFEIKASIAGAPGQNPGQSEAGDELATRVRITIEGWGLNGLENESYLCKQFGNWTSDENAAIKLAKDETSIWMWNKSADWRSFWGQSVNYGKLTENTLQFFAPAAFKNKVGTYGYTNENTSTVANLQIVGKDGKTINRPNQQKLTSVILRAKAEILDENGNPIADNDLVEYNGLYFTKDRFIAYVLDANKANLPYVYTKNVTVEGKDEATGKDIINVAENWKMIDAQKFIVDGDNNHVYVSAAEADLKELYGDKKIAVKKADGSFELVENYNFAELIKTIANFNKDTETKGYKGGAMYYNIPIAHLNTATYESNGDFKSWNEGSFGMVRNHTYQVMINSVKRLGTGLFNPDESDNSKPIIPDPDPEDPTYYLGATINILSWKIVNNFVDL